ncbi:MAG: hypothetical protein WC356_03700 [Candidatus Micrarchaeia archaeon]|jgi:hypothetical protein
MNERNELPWNERVNAIGINPDMATRHDITQMAAEIQELRERNKYLSNVCDRLSMQNLKQKIVATLDWMITQMDFQNANLEMFGGDSPELTEAKELQAELKK